MRIYDLEIFLKEFGFIKKDDEIASLLKEYYYKDYIVSIYKLASDRNKVLKNKKSDKYKIIFSKIEEVESIIKILPLKGKIGVQSYDSIKQSVTTTINEITNYEEVISDSVIDIIESIKTELPYEYRKMKIKKIING